MRAFLLFGLLTFNTACVAAAKGQSSLGAIDVYGSKRVSSIAISTDYGAKIEQWVRELNQGQPESVRLKQEIETSIKNKYDLAYVDLSLITYFAPSSGQYLTVDVVEPQDAAKRMDFLPQPTGHFEDPDDLIALWNEYLETAFDLQRSGQFQYPKSCPVWHCTHGFEHPKLASYLDQFNRRVPPNESKLARILKEDERAGFRANAAFLLAHIQNGASVARYSLESIRDPSSLVRNNTLRVLSEIANSHPEIDVPLAPVLNALEFPSTTDRNKAGYTLVGLSKLEKNKTPIAKSSGRTLLLMLKLAQPNNHDPAYQILQNISGKSFGDRDYDSWENWLASVMEAQ